MFNIMTNLDVQQFCDYWQICSVLTLNSSMSFRMALPRAPMMRAWTRRSSRMSSLTISCSAATSCSIAALASLAFLS